MVIHCLFEQSGTFKNEFKKLGYKAYDYDILNDFNETDYVIDLFAEINNAYDGKPSIFDHIQKEDLVLAFFPCIRFENQILFHFRGESFSFKKWTLEQKLEYCMKIHKELHELYIYICKLAIIAERHRIKLVIENPYSTQHYLTRYWCVKPSIIDDDRRENGDAFSKPTQYYFFNFEPKNNLVFEGITIHKRQRIDRLKIGAVRSLITPEYARRFIKTYLID